MQHLHNIVYGAEGMPTFIKVLCISGCTAIVTEGLLVLIVLYCEAFPVCPTYALMQAQYSTVHPITGHAGPEVE